MAILVVVLVAGLSAISLARLDVAGRELQDTDGYMRVSRVIDLVTGENGWFDGSVHWSNTPFGHSMHWTRPLDALLVALAAPLAPFSGWHDAVYWAGLASGPLLHLALAFAHILGGPFADASDELRRVWLDHVSESQPMWDTDAPVTVVAFRLGAAIAAIVVVVVLVRRERGSRRAPGWWFVAVWLMVTTVVALRSTRFALYPEATAAERASGDNGSARPASVLAHIDLGPELHARTGVDIVATPHHRDVDGILDARRIMRSDPDTARSLIDERSVDIILICPERDRLYLAPVPAGSLADRLLTEHPPEWLRAVPEHSDVADLYEVLR